METVQEYRLILEELERGEVPETYRAVLFSYGYDEEELTDADVIAAPSRFLSAELAGIAWQPWVHGEVGDLRERLAALCAAEPARKES